MNAPKKKQGSNRPKVDNNHDDPGKSSPTKPEPNNGSLEAETGVLEFPGKSETTVSTKELLKIFGVIALRIAAKRQKQEQHDTNI